MNNKRQRKSTSKAANWKASKDGVESEPSESEQQAVLLPPPPSKKAKSAPKKKQEKTVQQQSPLQPPLSQPQSQQQPPDDATLEERIRQNQEHLHAVEKQVSMSKSIYRFGNPSVMI
jgi:hypothetical protein